MALEIIGSSGYIADVDSSGNLKVNIEAPTGSTTVVQSSGANLHTNVDNFPATQPVSAATLPLPTGAAQDGTDATGVVAPTGAVGIRGWLSAIYNVLKNGSLAVTGTFYQTTQPVSGTFWQATQPVSAATLPLPTGAAQETGGNLATIASNTTTIATNTANETNGSQKAQISDPTSLTAANVVAKGIQGANAVAVQNLKDSGRNLVVLSCAPTVSVTAEALLSLVGWKSGAALAAATSYTVTTGKTLRIQKISLKAKFITPSTTITFANATLNIRVGTALTAATLVSQHNIDCNAEFSTPEVVLIFPDGLELASGTVFAISQIASAVTLDVQVSVVGYEY